MLKYILNCNLILNIKINVTHFFCVGNIYFLWLPLKVVVAVHKVIVPSEYFGKSLPDFFCWLCLPTEVYLTNDCPPRLYTLEILFRTGTSWKSKLQCTVVLSIDKIRMVRWIIPVWIFCPVPEVWTKEFFSIFGLHIVYMVG